MTRFAFTAALALAALSSAAPLTAASKAAKPAPAIAAPSAGQAQVVFFRPGGMGMAIRCTIRNNGAMIGQVGNGKYFVQPLAPGKYSFTTKTESTDTLTMELESGETYYVKCKIGAGVMSGRPNLSPSTRAEFEEKGGKLKVKSAAELAQDVAKDAADAAKAK